MALRLLIVLLILAIPMELPGCGPFFAEAVFVRQVVPESADFDKGTLGVIQPTYARRYLVVAYRYLAGVGLNDAERDAIEGAPTPIGDDPQSAIQAWTAARNGVAGVEPLADRSIDVFRQVKKDGYFDNYLNCNADAFRAATSTLQRVSKANSALEWVEAQDQVFSNCSKGATIPAPSSTPALRADRAYQIASAKFYAEQYDAARADFLAIGADSSSPWHAMGPYLAARCLIRGGKWDEAETALQQIATDPARRLLRFVKVRAHPEQRMRELALALVKPNSQATIGQDLTDYRYLFDQGSLAQKHPDDDLTDWIDTFQSKGVAAVERWRTRRSLPWLVAALESARPNDAAVAELLAAAAEVKFDSSAYVTVNYHRVRLLPMPEARSLAESMLTVRGLPLAARNQFRAKRMALGGDFEEFLKYAPREGIPDGDLAPGGQMLDVDSASVLNQAVPLSLLKQAAGKADLPVEIRNRLRSVAATRAVVLNPSPTFDEVWELLRTPGDTPFLQSGVGRQTENPKERNMFRQNWWCAGGKGGEDTTAQPPVAKFLSTAEQQQAASEWAKLSVLPPAPNWLSAEVVKFAVAHPADPRVPEALALVVTATRYGCTDANTGAASKAAFDLLHRKYPNSTWAKRTPYWYN